MTRHDTTDSALGVLRRPPVQRVLGSDHVVDLTDAAASRRAAADRGRAGELDAVSHLGVDHSTDSPDAPGPNGVAPADTLAGNVPAAERAALDEPAVDDAPGIDDATIGADEPDLTRPDLIEPGADELDVEERLALANVVIEVEILLPAVIPGQGAIADSGIGPAEGTDPEQSVPRIDPRLAELAAMKSTDPQHGSLRRTVIEAHLPLVHHLAQRFRGRGEPYDDLVQVGTIGLLHAVDRYDPSRGSFAAFAVPTIVGEIRRHFRDRGWALRIPRRVQDLGRRVSEAREALTHRLDRSPTVHEIAGYLQVDQELVLEALETASAYLTVPLPITADESDRMAKSFEDSGMELVEQRETLRPLLARLPARQQRILELRFARGMSQSQIATEIGVSQMHVSRLLAKSLAALRSGLTQEL